MATYTPPDPRGSQGAPVAQPSQASPPEPPAQQVAPTAIQPTGPPQGGTTPPPSAPGPPQGGKSMSLWDRLKNLVGAALMVMGAIFLLALSGPTIEDLFDDAQEFWQTQVEPKLPDVNVIWPGDAEGSSPESTPSPTPSPEPTSEPTPVPAPSAEADPTIEPSAAPAVVVTPEPVSSIQPTAIHVKVEKIPTATPLPEVTPQPATVEEEAEEEQPTPTPEPTAEPKAEVEVEDEPERSDPPAVKITIKVPEEAAEAIKAEAAPEVTDPPAEDVEVQEEELPEEEVTSTNVKVASSAGNTSDSVMITSSDATPPPLVDPEDYGLASVAERKAALEAMEVSDDDQKSTIKKSVPAVCLDIKRLNRDLVQNTWKQIPREGWHRFIEGWIDRPGYTNKLQKLYVPPGQNRRTLLGGAIYVMPKRCDKDQALKAYKQMPQPSWGKRGHEDDIRYLRRIGLMR